ncbi:MAG: hypothetical protein Ct9H300mP23_00760 [Nitrospinota bacterium]|nr:MAG: hypothetical protein Ct9H300mP23_00760 [Nitrospinota bacterium]
MTTESTPGYLLKFNPIALTHFIVIQGNGIVCLFSFCFFLECGCFNVFHVLVNSIDRNLSGLSSLFNSPRSSLPKWFGPILLCFAEPLLVKMAP